MNAEILLRKLVEMAGGASDRGYVLAFRTDGIDGLPGYLETGAGRYEVRHVETELGLRRTILKSNGAPFIALVSQELGSRLPKDLVLRAKGGRIHGLDVIDILETVLGVRVMGTDNPALQQLALKHIEAVKEEMEHRTRPTQIDRDLLDELLLDVCVQQRVRGARPGDLLAAWLRQPPEWEPALAEIVQRFLPKLHITEGRVLAWALESPVRLRAVLVHGTLLEVPGEVAAAIWGPLEQLEHSMAIDQLTLRKAIVQMAREAIDTLDTAAIPYLTEAESLGRKLLPAGMLARSSILQLGLDDRLLELAKKAAQGQPVAAEDVQTVRRHRASKVRRRQVEMVEDLARLSRWSSAPRPQLSSVADHVRHFQMHGAFADVAAARVMRTKAVVLEYNTQVEMVIAAYRARRDQDNHAFAELVAKDYTACLFKGGAVPLQNLWTEVASRAPGALDRKHGKDGLFLAVLDGCSYPAFLELVGELNCAPQSVGLTTADRPNEAARGLDALSPLPTITSYARGAIFLGRLPNDPAKPETDDVAEAEAATDKARFAQNELLAKRSRRLFLKGDLADGGQALIEALMGPLDVVAAVFNAIDDQIGSSNTGARLQVKAEEIAGLIPSFHAALAAGRRLLLAADHGHTPFWSKDGRVGAGEAPRWRKLERGEEPPAGFIEVDLHGLGNVEGRHAFAWKTGAYQGNPQVGFHGGCSLEEMVAPVAWLVRDGVLADEPAWWYGGGTFPVAEPARRAPDHPPARAPASTPLPTLRPQLDMFDAASRAAALPLSKEVLDALSAEARTILVLLRENGSLRSSELAKRLSKAPPRINGLLAQVRRTLHAAGFELFHAEVLPNGETLYRYRGGDS